MSVTSTAINFDKRQEPGIGHLVSSYW